MNRTSTPEDSKSINFPQKYKVQYNIERSNYGEKTPERSSFVSIKQGGKWSRQEKEKSPIQKTSSFATKLSNMKA